MKLAIVGSRSWTDAEKIEKAIFDFWMNNQIDESDLIIVSGGARGADKIAENWADANGVPKIIHLPDWDKYGKSAGFVRNKLIVQDCDVLICFWDGTSKGCMNSVKVAKELGKKVVLYQTEEGKKS